MGYNHIYHHFQAPQALLVLGGWLDREHFAAKFALQHPQLPIWVSGVATENIQNGYLPKLVLIWVGYIWTTERWIQLPISPPSWIPSNP
jgi:hypothetical protein